FRPFSRTRTSRARGFVGTGLGLAISQRLAQKLGGSISAQSSPGAGSTFTLTIPAEPWDEAPLINPPPRAPTAATTSPSPTAEPAKLECRVLVAEDNRDTQHVLALRLRLAGAQVTLAPNGRVAVDLALEARDKGQPFDVILMDMQMPILDGYEATRLLRAEGVRTPIVAVTAHAMVEDREECRRIGCDEFLSKPIDWEKLLRVIASAVISARGRLD